jgi:chromosome partitioning protein
VAHKIAVLSQKGGTGKTTAVRHLADVFRRAGLDVLAVDLDPQGNLSDYFDVDPTVEPTIGDVLTGRAKAKAAVHDGIIPANLSLAEAELQLAGKMGRELTLRKTLKDVDAEHDVILIDCPPALGLLTVNALVAADFALLSAEAQYFAPTSSGSAWSSTSRTCGRSTRARRTSRCASTSATSSLGP